MEILKKIIIVFVILLFGATGTYAQENVLNAFTESYKLEREGKNKEALAELKKVYNENSYEINLRLGWLAYLSGQFTESVSYYNNAISKFPLSVEARLGLVLPLSAMGNWDQIIEQYNTILKVDPKNTIVNYRLGVIYYERKQYDKAEKYLKKVIDLYPFDHDTLLMLGWVKFQQGDNKQAGILFNKALLANPSDDSAREGLSLIHR